MDGVDVALIETDGESVVRPIEGAQLSLAYEPSERDVLFQAVETALAINDPSAVRHPHLIAAMDLSTRRHCEAVQTLLAHLDAPVDVIGYHGQTVLHRPNPERPQAAFTLQLADAQRLATSAGTPVVYDFRSADVATGGQGAPLAPLYHQALLASRTELPAVILNLGGIANITYVPNSEPLHIMAADIGPANVFMDDLMREREGVAYDLNGARAAAGAVDQAVVDGFFDDRFFKQSGPKSLDRYSFGPPVLDHLSTEDAMATLLELTVHSVVLALIRLPQQPRTLFVAGGGARNTFLMKRLKSTLPCAVTVLDDIGASAAMLEAEAFGYLAVRHLMGLPTSYPNTTGVPAPMVGGELVKPA